MGQMKVAEDVAAGEFDRMCDAFRIDRDTSAFDETELAAWNELRDPIVRDICRGQLVIDPEGRPVYTPIGGKPITFSQPTCATLMALETHGRGKDVSNMMAAIGDMTGIGRGELSRLHARDGQALGRLARLFLADQ